MSHNWKVLLYGSEEEWNLERTLLKETYLSRIIDKTDTTTFATFLSDQLQQLQKSVPLTEPSCMKSGCCWSSVRVQELQRQYLKQIYLLYEKGVGSNYMFSSLWHTFPHRRASDSSCKCSENGDVTELEERFYRNVWIDFTEGRVHSFDIAATLLHDTYLKVPKNNGRKRWGEATNYILPVTPYQRLLWCSRLAFIGVREAKNNLVQVSYYGKLGPLSAKDDLHMSHKQRLRLLKQCAFDYRACMAAMDLWFTAQYDTLHEKKVYLDVEQRCQILKHLVQFDLKRKTGFRTCVRSFITNEDYEVRGISSARLKRIALECGLKTPRNRIAILYERAKLGDHGYLRDFLLCCQDVPDEDPGFQLFRRAHVTSEEKKVWFETLQDLKPSLTAYSLQQKKRKELGNEKFFEWQKLIAWRDATCEVAEEYARSLTYRYNFEEEMIFLAISGCTTAWQWCASHLGKHDDELFLLKASMDKAMLIGFWKSIQDGKLIIRCNGIPPYFKKRWRHKEAWITCICEGFALLRSVEHC